MLLPSALSCDTSQPPLTRLQSALFASPPASPPQMSTATSGFSNILTTCRNLQSLLAAPADLSTAVAPISPPTTSHAQLPTPPLAHAPSPLKLRLRSRRAKTGAPATPITTTSDKPFASQRKRIVKRAPPRGANKRRRSAEDDMGRDDDDVNSDLDLGSGSDERHGSAQESSTPRPHTPKRARIAPEVIPLGLERSDFHSLHHADGVPPGQAGGSDAAGGDRTDVEVEADGEAWSTEEDRILVELVLEKLKLTKLDWHDCARSLGKDRSSVGRRWKSLMLYGDVGLKSSGRNSRRGKIHGTWR